MRKTIIIAVTACLAGAPILWAASNDSQALDFARLLIQKSGHAERGSLDALRFFQFTTTTTANNPDSYVLDSKEAVAESGLKPGDRGRYIKALADRSGPRLHRLWGPNKAALFAMLPAPRYAELAKDKVDSLLNYRNSNKYAAQLAALKAKRLSGPKVMGAAGEITSWENYKELGFWYRRSQEKNEAAVLTILKEIQAHYAK